MVRQATHGNDHIDQIDFGGKVALITDSVAQVPQDLAEELDISVIPFWLHLEGDNYRDGIELTADRLYQRMRNEKVLPKTSAPSVGQYYDVFLERLRRGASAVLYIGLSMQLSAAFSSAEAAAFLAGEDFPENRIVLFDSRSATIAQGFVAIEAARLALKGASLEQVLDRAKQTRSRSGFVVTLETLEYLAMGGRIGKAAYMLGSLVDIKPIVTIGEGGLVAPLGRVRGEHRAIEEIVDRVVSVVGGCRRLSLAVIQADAARQAAQIEKLALEKLPVDELFWSSITPVMGAHSGPGTFGLAYCYD